MRARLAAMIVSAILVAASPSLVRAYCTYGYNPWAKACQESDGEEACEALWEAELETPSVVMHAIPVYLNFDQTPFPIDHPNYPGDPTKQIQIHRSLELTGLDKEVVTTQVRAALAHWNQSMAGHPMLYLAGEAFGDSSQIENRPVGITIYSDTCFNREPTVSARGGTGLAGWSAGGGVAYRGAVSIAPYLHSVEGIPAGSCYSLPYDLKPREIVDCEDSDDPDCVPGVDPEGPAIPFTQFTRTSRIRDGFQRVLVHEIGHALALHHNFFGVDEAPNSCGLGDFGDDTFGVMSYDVKYTHPRRDDAMGVRDLYADFLPAAWSMQAWRRLHNLPGSLDDENTLSGLETTVMPILTNQVVTPSGQVAIAYADADHQVRVRTITLGALDPVVGADDLPLAGENGKTFTPPAIAMRSNGAQQLFVAWNRDEPDRPELLTHWALRDGPGDPWTVFGPLSLGTIEDGIVRDDDPPPEDPSRFHPPLGVTFDPVHQDYVLVTVSNNFRPAIATFDTDGQLGSVPGVLRVDAPGPLSRMVDDYNSVGAPVCVATASSDRSLCLLPVATSGDQNTVGVLAFSRTASDGVVTTGLVQQWLADGHQAFGHLTLSWNDRTNQGELAYADDRGDVRWLHVQVGLRDGVQFGPAGWDMEGNGRYAPESLDAPPREVAQALQSTWPVCPYWSASGGAAGYDIPLTSSWVSAARGVCRGVCGDGFIDPPPWGIEECDGDDLGGATCQDFGFDGGTLSCGDQCRINVDECFDNPPPDPGDCQPVTTSCIDPTADGCHPDGPGSYGKNGDGDSPHAFYCPDTDGPAVCSFTRERDDLVPTCIACPDPGGGGGEAGYGCACASDDDCARTGWASTDSAPSGTEVPLACFGSVDQGWPGGNGRCLPAIDPGAPQTQTEEQAVREEFERTRWLCKQNCDAIEDVTGLDHRCHYRQNGISFTYAACIEVEGCFAGGVPLLGGQCEESGGACGADSGVCEAQCDPDANTSGGNPDCAGRGFPDWYLCAYGWEAEGFCVPPECAPDPVSSGLDQSECQQFVNAELY